MGDQPEMDAFGAGGPGGKAPFGLPAGVKPLPFVPLLDVLCRSRKCGNGEGASEEGAQLCWLFQAVTQRLPALLLRTGWHVVPEARRALWVRVLPHSVVTQRMYAGDGRYEATMSDTTYMVPPPGEIAK